MALTKALFMSEIKKLKEELKKDVEDIKEAILKDIRKEVEEVKDELRKEVEDMKEDILKDIRKEVEEVKKGMEFVEERYEEMKKENEKMIAEVKEVKSLNTALSQELGLVKQKSKLALVTANEIDNYLRLHSLEIHGVPAAKSDNVVMDVLKVADASLSENDIGSVRRIGNPKDKDGKNKATRPILVTLKSVDRRMHIYQHKKKLYKHDLSNIGLDKVFINENLSPHSKSLFFQANKLKKEKKWSYIWTNNCTIYVRKTDNTPAVKIQDEADLLLIK